MVDVNQTSVTQPSDYPLLHNRTYRIDFSVLRWVDGSLRGRDQAGNVSQTFTTVP